MYNTYRFLGLCIALAAISTVHAHAQGQTGPSPLGFIVETSRIGFEAGFSFVSQDGTYLAGCGTFTEGSGLNLTAGFAFDYPLSGAVRVEALAGIHSRSVNGSYTSTENTVIQTNDDVIETNIDFENVGDARFTYLFLQPSIKYYFIKSYFTNEGLSVYLGLGASAGLKASASTQYTKNILTKAIEPTAGEFVEVFYPLSEASDPHSLVFAEENRSDASGIALDGIVYLGMELPISKKVMIGPRVSYGLPFSTVFSDPEMKLSLFSITVGGRYIL